MADMGVYEFIKDTADPISNLVNAILWFLPRTLVCFSIWPLFSQTLTSPFIRNAAAVSFSFLPATFFMNIADVKSRPFLDILFFSLREVAVGLMLGLTIALPFFAFRVFGAYVDAWRGATFATLIDPTTGQDELVTEKLMMYCFTLLFIAGPSLMLSIQTLYDSFILLPPGTMQLESLETWTSTLIDLFSRHMMYAFVIGGPVFIAVVLVEVALSMISVYAPSLQVYSIDAAVKSIVSIGVLAAMFEFAGDDIMLLMTKNIHTVAALFGSKTATP